VTDHEAILARLAELAADNHHDQEDFALRMALACQTILGADGAAITVETNTSRRTTLCATDAVVARLEDLQDVTGEGPCRDAYQLDEPIVARIGEGSAERWPTFSPAVLQAVGQLTIHTFPMRADGQIYGAISLYVAGDRELPEPHGAAQLLVDAIGTALLHAPVTELVGADRASASRETVHQATGMVIAQLGISAADALAILRAHAYTTDQTLADVAGDVIGRRLDFKDLDSDD
jgi:hypothetical protein